MSQLVKTKREANFKDFKRFGAFKGLVEQKTYSIRSCVNWAFFGTRGPLKRSFPNLRTNSLNKLLFSIGTPHLLLHWSITFSQLWDICI
jgi:hypothetical protein